MSEHESKPRGSGRLAAVGGALLLLVAGFVVGLIAGAAFEDPKLVLGSLTGRGRDVPLEAGDRFDPGLAEGADVGLEGAEPQPPEEEAARAAGGAAPRPREAPVVSAGPAAPGPSVSAPPPGSAGAAPPPRAPRGWAVQVGAFTEEAIAERLAKRLRERDLDVYVAHDTPGGRPRFRVRVGPLASEGDARALARRLETEQRLPTWVLREDG